MTEGMTIVGYAVLNAHLIEDQQIRDQLQHIGESPTGRYGALFVYDRDEHGSSKKWTLFTANPDYADADQEHSNRRVRHRHAARQIPCLPTGLGHHRGQLSHLAAGRRVPAGHTRTCSRPCPGPISAHIDFPRGPSLRRRRPRADELRTRSHARARDFGGAPIPGRGGRVRRRRRALAGGGVAVMRWSPGACSVSVVDAGCDAASRHSAFLRIFAPGHGFDRRWDYAWRWGRV